VTASSRPDGHRGREPMAALAILFLLLGTALVVGGATMYGARNDCQLQFGPCAAVGAGSALERSLFAASVIATVTGLRLVAELTRGTAGLGLALAGASLYLFGGVLIVTSELALVGGLTLPHSLRVGYVVLAFVGQATLGWGLTMGLTTMRVVGWATVVFNLGALAALWLLSPGDMYVPIVHNVAPTAIAVALLIRRWSATKVRQPA
jgi:hypothetical protein